MYEKALRFIKDILFPVFCVECGQEGGWWCEECLKKTIFLPVCACPVCAIATERGETCQNCRAVSPLDGIAAFFIYTEGAPTAKLIEQFKYNFAFDIAEVWRKIMLRGLEGRNPVPSVIPSGIEGSPRFSRDNKMTIVPIPLYPRRERERGFNQANILSEIYADITKKPADASFAVDNKSLKRVRYTGQQAKLNRLERQKNVKDAFVWRGETAAPDNVILVDDVFTTGATMQECARVLKANGAKWIWGITLARGL